ncbi:hypothetical protein, partial [Marinobacter sp.]|uniref:hypothetical protein n=1 Tax=Marinobacter sp. TaxID=50741 RepID=UPI0035C70F0C
MPRFGGRGIVWADAADPGGGLVSLIPVVADAGFHQQGDVKLGGRGHALDHNQTESTAPAMRLSSCLMP